MSVSALVAKIDLSGARIGDHLRPGAFDDHLAEMQQRDPLGKFKRHVIAQDEPGWFERHAIGDINKDGKPDVVVVNNRDGHVLWFANSDRPR